MPSPDNSFDSARHLLRVWRASARAATVREMEFRFNFFSGLVRQVAWLATFVLMIHVIYQHTDSLAGWSQLQVLTLLALSRIIEGLSDAFFHRNIAELPGVIQNGKFDFYLTKPVPAQFHTAFHRFRFLDLGNAAIGLVLLIYAVVRDPSMFTWTGWLLFAVLALLGLAVYYSILIIMVSVAFKFERFDGFFALDNLISEPLTAPFDIFPPGTKAVLTYLLPLAFIVFVPAEALTGRLEMPQLPISFL